MRNHYIETREHLINMGSTVLQTLAGEDGFALCGFRAWCPDGIEFSYCPLLTLEQVRIDIRVLVEPCEAAELEQTSSSQEYMGASVILQNESEIDGVVGEMLSHLDVARLLVKYDNLIDLSEYWKVEYRGTKNYPKSPLY